MTAITIPNLRLLSLFVLIAGLSACGGDGGRGGAPSYTVTTTSGEGGSITPASQTVKQGATAPFIVIPDEGYGIATVDGCNGTLSGNTFTTGPITADCTVMASFVPTHTIGGTVSGLAGTVVLENSGKDRLTISADGPFVFASPVARGTAYDVTVETQPANQQCSVVGGSGTATANVTSVDVQCFASVELDANPLSKVVEFGWNDVGATSYDLYYSTNPACDIDFINACPDGVVMNGVTSPHSVTALTNGQHYSFWLKANHAGGHATIGESGARPDKLMVNDTVFALATGDEGTFYLGGGFTRIGPRSGGGVPFMATATGTRPFPVVNGEVHAVASDGVGGWYIGGTFTRVGTEPRNRLAHVLADGTVGEWNPDANRDVYALAVSGSTVYAGGLFTSIGGQARNSLAAIGTDGTPGTWNPNTDGWINAFAVSGSTVYAGGYFTTIGGQARNNLAAIGTDGTLGHWDPHADGRICTLAVSGSTVYAGGEFTHIDGQDRNHLAAITTDGTLATWNPDVNNHVTALAVSDSTVYVGGMFTTIGGQARSNLAAIGTNGSLADWNPGADGYVRALAVSSETVYAGGDFRSIGEMPRNNLAAIGTDGTLSSTWDPAANHTVFALAASGSTVYAGGSFTAIDNEVAGYLAELPLAPDP